LGKDAIEKQPGKKRGTNGTKHNQRELTGAETSQEKSHKKGVNKGLLWQGKS